MSKVPPGQLTLHTDRGGPIKAKTTALMLANLGVTKSHSRPHTSNDNPFSEAHLKTLKDQPDFPKRFDCIQDAKDFCRRFFSWYNRDHRPAGLGWCPRSGPLRPSRRRPKHTRPRFPLEPRAVGRKGT
jgi:transposase InsO family protein